VEIRVRDGSSTAAYATEKYYDETSGKFKIRTDENGVPELIGASKSVYLEIYAYYGNMQTSVKGSVNLVPMHGRLYSSVSSSFIGQQIGYGNLYATFYDEIKGDYGLSVYTSYDYAENKYYILKDGVRNYLDITLFTQDGAEVENPFNDYGAYNMSHSDDRKYYLHFGTEIDGVPLSFTTSTFTVSGYGKHKTSTSKNSKVTYVSFSGYFDPATGESSTFYWYVNGGYAQINDVKYDASVKVFSNDGSVEYDISHIMNITTDDEGNTSVSATANSGLYRLEFTYTAEIDGVPTEIVYKVIWRLN
jgi:hypothetical protein